MALSKYKQEDLTNHINLYKKWFNIDIQSGDRPPNILDYSKHIKKVVIWTGPAWEPWNKKKVDKGMAGSETWASYLAREFVKKGFRTTIYNDLLSDSKNDIILDPVLDDNGEKIGDVVYRDHTKMLGDVEYDVVDYFIASRSTEPLKLNVHSLKSYVMIHDIWLSADKNYDVMTWRVDKYAYLSEWHKQFIMKHHGIISDKMFLTANGQDMDLYKDVDTYTKKNMAVYSSSPDRGLYQLLKMVPAIRKEIPDFELVVAYGFFNWESMAKLRGDTESLNFINEIKLLMDQPGVKFVDRVSKKQLANYEKQSKIWLYPTHFHETFCCLPGTSITTVEGSYPIESINIGEKVLTHTGGIKPVTHIFVRKVDEDINNIKVKYLMDPLRITGNHNLLVLKKDSESLHCVRMQHTSCTKRALKCGSNVKYCKKYRTNEECWKLSKSYISEWVPAESLNKGDYVLYPKNKKNNIPGNLSSYSSGVLLDGSISYNNRAKKIKDFVITDRFLHFCGWFISEGCYDGRSTVIFSLHKKEKDVSDFLFDMGKELGLNPWICYSKDSESMTVNMSSSILGRFLTENFGDGAKYKFIPQWVKDLNPEFLKYVVSGILKGDGYQNKGTFVLECSSKQLVTDMFDVLLKFNCVSSLSSSSKRQILKYKEKGVYKIKRGKKTLTAYRLCCSLSQNQELFRFIGYNVKDTKSTGQAALQDDQYVYLPIISNKRERYIGPVYNLEVKDDNTYVANNVIVHNCITAVGAGLSKNAIVTSSIGGLQTTVGSSGILLSPEGLSRNGEYPKSYTDRFIEEAVKMLSNESYRLEWASKAYEKMKMYTWSNIADEWIKQFNPKK